MAERVTDQVWSVEGEFSGDQMTKEQVELLAEWKDVFTQARMHTKPIAADETLETIAAAAISASMIVAILKVEQVFAPQKP